MPTLANKIALITGGSRGIGAAITKRLARDGAAVAFTYSSAKAKADEVVRDIESAGGKALAISADSASPDAVRAAVAQTVKSLGRVDILVNNAGLAVMAPLSEYKLEDFDRLVAVNIRAVFIASQEASRHMPDGGRIITIGSTNADRMPFPGGSVYAMTKAAVAGLTRGMSRDLGPRGITVNAVQPGPVDTDMNPATGPFADSLRSLMALPRYGKPEEIAALVSHLAGPEAAFITGACLTIDGGFAT
jgi:3-oxoacyl-[acyl-carrier protein] reductase